ncbi:MAG: tRNA (N(6)-L-threonylcarbamoyladenosine(37)-C(2))-methylthiotransferase MtaB [Bacillota bacterium]|nr:tRNA (N(6)-L-threonylcarbamoyladenosine(37)-C(2))-methylthiotransferase MtaB [Bacillota bacterium]
MTVKKLATSTLGCKVNQYDTDSVITQFLARGYKVVDFNEKADVYLINTCTVTNLGDRKSRQMIRRAHKNNPLAKVVVMGCLAQMAPDEILDIEGVDLIVGTDGRGHIVDKIESFNEADVDSTVKDIFEVTEFEDLPTLDFSGRTRASLKIQDGCNQFCTYCRVPFARGRSRSRQRDSVLRQVERIVAEGYREIVLTGIHLGFYGKDLDSSISLTEIVRDVTQVEGLLRLRIGSVEPNEFTDELIDLVANNPVLCRHVHLPLQSGSDAILSKMKRSYSRTEFLEVARKVKQAIPDVGLTTDIMVGFPGETEEDFQQTLDLMQEVGFSKIHVFKYSKREGTRAAKFTQQVPGNIKEIRSKRLIEKGNALALVFHQSFIGNEVEVLVEQVNNGQAMGHTDNYMRVAFDFESEVDPVGKIMKIRVQSADSHDLKGHLASP